MVSRISHAPVNEDKPATKVEEITPSPVPSPHPLICTAEHTMYLNSVQLQEQLWVTRCL